ncbi:MAG: hypothetical protein KDC92_00635, partial [Bacteroidetes bacterium]|nr:hypothetical protein [Bacteroidota bacterium]
MKKLLLLFLVLNTTTVFAQKTGYFEKSLSFNSESRTVSYYVPSNYNSSKQYHLIVGLHGIGDNSAHYVDLLTEKGYQNLFEYTIIICPDGGDDYFGDFYTPAGDEHFIDTCIEDAITNYSINVDHIILQGFSLGGRAALKYGLDNTNKFSALLLNTPGLQGALDATQNSKITLGYSYQNASKIPIYLTIGLLDRFYVNVEGILY